MKISINCLLNTLSLTRTALRNASHIVFDPLNTTIAWTKERMIWTEQHGDKAGPRKGAISVYFTFHCGALFSKAKAQCLQMGTQGKTEETF